MSTGFLYWIPGVTQQMATDKAKLIELGLGHIFDKTSVIEPWEVMTAGPDKANRGFVIVRQGSVDDTKRQYRPNDADQLWHKIPGSKCMIGYYASDRPTPDVLKRPDMLPGAQVVLNDDNPWQVPVARNWLIHEGQFGYELQLPRRPSRDENGNWGFREVLDKYRPLEDIAARFLSGMAVNEFFASIGMVLGFNYYVSQDELDALRILDQNNTGRIMYALIDQAGHDEIKKKVATEASSSSDGSSV